MVYGECLNEVGRKRKERRREERRKGGVWRGKNVSIRIGCITSVALEPILLVCSSIKYITYMQKMKL